MAIFNDIMTSAYLYTLLVLTDYSQYSVSRATIGMTLLLIVCITVFVNLFKALITDCKSLIEYNQNEYLKAKKYSSSTDNK
jgi:hypothetical protein